MILGSHRSSLGSLGAQLGGVFPRSPSATSVTQTFEGVHVVHVTAGSPLTVTITSDGPPLRRRSSGSPTVRNIEGQ